MNSSTLSIYKTLQQQKLRLTADYLMVTISALTNLVAPKLFGSVLDLIVTNFDLNLEIKNWILKHDFNIFCGKLDSAPTFEMSLR